MKLLQKELHKIHCKRALDVATRHGEFALKLLSGLKSCHEVIGIDTSAKAIEQATQKHAQERLRFCVMDAEHLDFDDASFDLVALSNSLHHMRKVDVVLREMLRVLRPGGIFVVNEMFSDKQSPAQTTHAALHSLEGKIDTLLGKFHNSPYTRDVIIQTCAMLGLTDMTNFDDLETDPTLSKKLGMRVEGLLEAVGKVAHTSAYTTLVQEAELIRLSFADHGIERCTQLVVMGRK